MGRCFDPRITPARPDLAAKSLESWVKAPRYVDGEVKRVAVARAPMRGSPDLRASATSEVLFGEEFTVYEEKNGWAWGQLGRDGYVGYVEANALQTLGANPTHWLQALHSHVYPAPDLKQPPLGPIYFGSLVTTRPVIENNFIQLENGGWVTLKHLLPLGAPLDDFVATAERFLGTPYLWGGRSAAGIDCSGLVQMAILASGHAAPRDSDQQTSLGEGVAMEATRARGDIVCFPGHVGIMLDESRLLHANATHMAVTIDPLEDVMAMVKGQIKDPATPVISAVRRL